ncbi:MAG: glycosyltransferase family 4 protein [Cytophagales bacterium]|nr:glycosyltransferase family 4 protein [Cytophagales bacterium]
MKQGITIGLVLSSVPSYSETFFTTKVNGLSELGYSILLFAKGKRPAHLNCKVIKPYPVAGGFGLRLLYLSVVLLVSLIRAPRSVIRLWQYERKDGLQLGSILKSIYINAHILPYKVAWLHMGFAAMGVGRENVAKAIGAKLAVSFRGFDIDVFPLKHPDCYNRLWMKVDKIHSISQHLLDRAKTLGLSNSIPTQIVYPAVQENLPVKSNFEFKNPLQIVTVARLTWIKGLPYALQAIAKLKALGIPVRYSIVGGGPDHEYLLHEIHELKIADQVTLEGKLSHSRTLELIGEADLYLQPSLNEGFCNAVLEAQAMGCLCIASKIGGLIENIEDGVTGWLVEPRNPEAITAVILKILNLSVDARTDLAGRARVRVHSMFLKDRQIAAWNGFYQSH